jgi:hypothetical protein
MHKRFIAPLLLFILCATAAATVAIAAPRKMVDASIVVMRTIDKLSARTHTFEIPVDKTVKFGNSLFIKVRSCRRASPLDRPESAAFMQIWERKPHEKDSRWIFSGWMFASNPSLSPMDHPVYDVWIMECKNAATSEKPSEVFSSEKTPEHAPEKDAAATGADPGTEDVDTEAAPDDTEAAPDKPAASPVLPAAKPSPMPPIEKLPGSFEDGEASPEE